MNVLIDYHHTDLAQSLHLLFERLGFTVYVPDGLDWFEQGIWRQGHEHFGDAIARQFLLAPDVDDLNPTRTLNRVNLETARGMDWDVVVATVPDNYDGYRAFARSKDARFVIEVGNVNQYIDSADLILDSTGKYPDGVAFTPEFDIDGAFRYSPADAHQVVASFVNLFPRLPCYADFEAVKNAQERANPHEWDWRVYGHHGMDGFIKPTAAIGGLMRHASFGWQDKVSGDGFGYVIHYWASVGRPLIGHASHYYGQAAFDLWEDLVTCIDLDLHPPAEVAKLMESLVKSDRLEEMGEILSQRVRARIDFAADAERVAQALGMAVPV